MTHDHWTEVKVAREATLSPPDKAAAKLASQNKLYVRDRIALLVDEGSFVEDAQLANALNPGLPADGVVTGRALVDGRPALLVANDPTVKAGSWGARTVEIEVVAVRHARRQIRGRALVGHEIGSPRLRAITSRWISLVPSPISRILASR